MLQNTLWGPQPRLNEIPSSVVLELPTCTLSKHIVVNITLVRILPNRLKPQWKQIVSITFTAESSSVSTRIPREVAGVPYFFPQLLITRLLQLPILLFQPSNICETIPCIKCPLFEIHNMVSIFLTMLTITNINFKSLALNANKRVKHSHSPVSYTHPITFSLASFYLFLRHLLRI